MDVSNKFAGEEKNYFKILWKLIPKIPFDSHVPAKLLKLLSEFKFLSFPLFRGKFSNIH